MNKNLESVRQIIINETFKILGVKFDIAERVLSLHDLKEEWFSLGCIDISPAMCGPVGAMFSNINCGVKVGYVECKTDASKPAEVHFEFAYDYNHPNGGHNGYTLRTVRSVA